MSRTILTPQVCVVAGITPTATKIPAAGVEFVNDGKTLLLLKNTHSGTVVATITPGATVDGLGVATKTISLAAGVQHIVGPFPREIYNQSGGKMYIDADIADKMECSPISFTPSA